MAETEREDELAVREAEHAAAEAGRVGGSASSERSPSDGAGDEAQRPLTGAGQGEAEGFEQAEQELVERASHGDQHAARCVTEDAPEESDDVLAGPGGEADGEHSSERVDDDR